MEKIAAPCGLDCSRCPAYTATQNDDDEARRKTAAYYAERFGFDLTPEQINCDGCLADSGRKMGYCRSCGIRRCCLEKGVDHCVRCNEQPCEELSAFHRFSPEAKASFDRLAAGRDPL